MNDAERATIRESLQENLSNEDVETAVLTGYIVIAQWSDGAGDEWLTRTVGNINDECPSAWTIKGWLAHAADSLAA